MKITDGKGGWYTTENGDRVQLTQKMIAEGDYEYVDAFESPAAAVAAAAEDHQLLSSLATVDPDERTAELERLLAEAQETIAAQEVAIEELMPQVSVSDFMFDTREDVIAFFGLENIRDKIRDQIATLNRQRTREGYDRVPLTDDEVEERVDQFIDGLLRDREATTPPTEGWLDRTLKMVKTEKRKDGTVVKQLIQIPYEGQINNVAGSLADGYIRYERKGLKRTRPMLCPAKDCWLVAVEIDGSYRFGGYCSEDHQRRTARGEDVPE